MNAPDRYVRLSKRIGQWALVALVGAAAVGVSLYVELPQSIDSHARIAPQRQWIVTRDTDGRLLATLSDHRRGTMQNYTVLHFERGDHISFRLHPAIISGGAVQAGDTVATIHSNRTQQELARLQNRLATAQSSLELTRSGRKEAVILEAEQYLRQARTQATYQTRKVERLRTLFANQIATTEELEVEENAQALYQIQIEIAQAQLQAAQSGARLPEVKLIGTRIEGLQREIAILSQRLGSLAVIAPLDGVVSSTAADTLLAIQDRSAYLALLPIPWKDRNAVALEQTVELRPEGAASPVPGRIIRLDRNVRYFNRTQVLTALVALPANANLDPGLVVSSHLACPPLTLFQYLAKAFAR
ncbi:MAG: hypothetical protein GKR89_10705 [Candidatus Latescibacteria bacterium]|nr:hypothetical protein [Candidatus Latescibacterota bacterium]